MTIQVYHPEHGKNKATLAAAMNADPEKVRFYNPTPFGASYFTAAKVTPGESFPVVMDPQTRRRFAIVKRNADGTFKVE